jgi:hypothetical protein
MQTDGCRGDKGERADRLGGIFGNPSRLTFAGVAVALGHAKSTGSTLLRSTDGMQAIK